MSLTIFTYYCPKLPPSTVSNIGKLLLQVLDLKLTLSRIQYCSQSVQLWNSLIKLDKSMFKLPSGARCMAWEEGKSTGCDI